MRHPLPRLLTLAGLIAASSCAPASPPYRGLQLDDLRDADGWYHLPDFRYRGEVRGGQPNGASEALYPDGIRVASSFRDGVPNGPARVEVPQVGTFTGEMVAGRMPQGEFVGRNGDYYRGGLSAWQPEGAGLLVRADESRYTGGFKGGVPNGRGVAYDPRTRELVDGTFVNGRPDGSAVVTNAGAPSIRDYQQGRDVTTERVADRARELALGPADREIAQGKAALAAMQDRTNEASSRLSRFETMRLPSGIERFNKECACHLKASVNRDGSVYIGADGCLLLVDSNAPTPTEAQKRLWEERERAQARACSAWAKDINDPALASRTAEVRAEFTQRARELAAAAEAQRRAEADRARFAAELQAREAAQRTARAREALARAEAERQAEARKRAEERKRACAGSICCYCVDVKPGTKAQDIKCAPCA